jgi:UDP-N-acetylglucosamine--N-acetylmuramyl-(pentapeptide) pyrophosphoryl-undecaprenol N-acetylglucosamine transferase
MSNSLVILAAGGTGGHLFPAEALARELMSRGRAVALVTDRRGQAFPVDGVTTYRVPAGRNGAGIVARVKGVVEIARGVLAASALLKRLAPGAVVGFGGYPSVPTMVAARRLGLPTVIHEQNAVLGRANRMLAPGVARVATAFASVAGLGASDRGKIVQTGNPVRPAILAVRDRPYAPPMEAGEIRLLVTGGSQGARILSRIVPAALTRLPPSLQKRLTVSQQVRPEDLEQVAAAYHGSGLDIEMRSFFDDIPVRLAAAHLVIGRAGGSTTAELTVAGRPAILVPLASALADEQTANARELADRGAAWLVPESGFTAEALAALLERILGDPAGLVRAAAAAHALGQPAAAAALADLVDSLGSGGRS